MTEPLSPSCSRRQLLKAGLTGASALTLGNLPAASAVAAPAPARQPTLIAEENAHLLIAELGGPLWILLALLVPLVTVGLPSLVAVLLLASMWPGPSAQAFLIAAAILAFCFQFAAVALLRKYVPYAGRAGLRSAGARRTRTR